MYPNMKQNNKLLLGGIIAGALGLAFSNRKKITSIAVDILKSVGRTFVNEGVWYAEPAGGSKDKGDYYPQTGNNRIFYGTNYGVTAGFLVEYFNVLQIPLTDKNVIKNLTAEQARGIFTKVIGGRMRYNEYKNQFIADFIFDWMVQRPSTCIAYMTESIFGWSNAEKQAEINRATYSDRLLNAINGSNPSELYNALKFWRLYHLTYTDVYMSFRKGVYNRIVKYKDFPNTPKVSEMQEIARKKAFNNITAPQINGTQRL